MGHTLRHEMSSHMEQTLLGKQCTKAKHLFEQLFVRIWEAGGFGRTTLKVDIRWLNVRLLTI